MVSDKIKVPFFYDRYVQGVMSAYYQQLKNPYRATYYFNEKLPCGKDDIEYFLEKFSRENSLLPGVYDVVRTLLFHNEKFNPEHEKIAKNRWKLEENKDRKDNTVSAKSIIGESGIVNSDNDNLSDDISNENMIFAHKIVKEICENSDLRKALKIEFAKVGKDFSLEEIKVADHPALPTTAPKLWENRNEADPKNPAAFILHYYEAWLTAGIFPRNHIRDLDPKLYFAYAQWIRRHPDDVIAFSSTEWRLPNRIADSREATDRRRAVDRASKARRRRSSMMNEP